MLAKMHLNQKVISGKGDGRTVQLHFAAGTSDENGAWAKWTPSAQFSITVNADVAEAYEPGEDYYLEIRPYTKPEPVEDASA